MLSTNVNINCKSSFLLFFFYFQRSKISMRCCRFFFCSVHELGQGVIDNWVLIVKSWNPIKQDKNPAEMQCADRETFQIDQKE